MSDSAPLPDDRELRERLDPEAYRVTRLKGTEPPFTGKYVHATNPGTFTCVCCGAPLFRTEHKYDSGSGWPSFHSPHPEAAIAEIRDSSHGMHRTEVRCARCDAHLGHVFPDGPRPTGRRYCINSVALDLKSEGPESPADAD